MTKFIVAVSGGIDSMVLLDMMTQKMSPQDIVVAHFDHGIRSDSADDAVFVRHHAQSYGVDFETRREVLGSGASEELARDRRYAFLWDVAKKHAGVIVTAHHKDDLVETIAINLLRGTGWRGVAVLNSPGILRPLLDMTKDDIKDYASLNLLDWHEDSTNTNTKYLRNDVRQKLVHLDDDTKELLRLYRNRQQNISRMIDTETNALLRSPYSRYLFTNVPDSAALELLRSVLVWDIGQSPVRPHLERALLAIKTYQAGKVFAIDAEHVLSFSLTDFVVQRSA